MKNILTKISTKLKCNFKEDFINSKEFDNLSKDEKIKILRKSLSKCNNELEKLKKKYADIFLSKLKTRRSIRKFSGKEVPWEIVYNILESAYTAPAAGDIKDYKFIVVRDKEDRVELSKICYQQYWISDAPYIIVVVRDDKHLVELYPNMGKKYSIQNTAAAIENLLLTVHFYDLGACWVEAYNNDAIRDFLEIPNSFYVDAIIPIGYPLENPKKSMPLLRGRIFFDKFGNIYRNKK